MPRFTRHLLGLVPAPDTTRALGLGVTLATASLLALLASRAQSGVEELAHLADSRFQVAILAGPKQAAQTAPDNVQQQAAAVVSAPSKTATQAVTAERPTQLPEAVTAAPDSKPTAMVAAPEQVLPPALVSMPGGQLAVEDAPSGDIPDPFHVGRRQVYIRLLVDPDGKVVRGAIVRGGQEPLRDAIILKAMMSRSFVQAPGGLRVTGSDLRQFDMVLDYGAQDYLP